MRLWGKTIASCWQKLWSPNLDCRKIQINLKDIAEIITAWKVSIFGVILVHVFPYTLRISPYSVRIRENTDQKNSEYGHFLRSDWWFYLEAAAVPFNCRIWLNFYNSKSLRRLLWVHIFVFHDCILNRKLISSYIKKMLKPIDFYQMASSKFRNQIMPAALQNGPKELKETVSTYHLQILQFFNICPVICNK